jgi:hypothetical protein
MPNMIAYGALLAWPLITLVIFATVSLRKAIIWSLLLGYLLLPVRTAFDFPGVPALDKTSIANLSALIGAMMFSSRPILRLPREWWLTGLMGVYVASPMATVIGNPDPLIYGDLVLQGLRPYDAFSAAAYKAIDLIPFMLGYNLLSRTQDRHQVLRAMVIAALGYSVLMLVEVRLSPQLHNWIYGFFPHSFGQQVRGEGFRPVVFLGHGLLVAIFSSMAVVSAAYLAKRREPLLGLPPTVTLLYLAAMLFLCRSLGALVLAVGALAAIFLLRGRRIAHVCAIGALIVLSYPMLRGADLVPVQAFADQLKGVAADRAASFQVRIDNENALLERARERPLFGWGGFGRNRVYDDATGKDLSVTDGTWVIIIGTYGWVGYLASFGLICLPLITHGLRRRSQYDAVGAALSLVLLLNLLDLLPNSSLSPLTWLFAGAIASKVIVGQSNFRQPRLSGALPPENGTMRSQSFPR